MGAEGEPGVKGLAAVGFAGAGLGVGPLVGQGAVEPLDLAVGLGPVGAGPVVGDAQLSAGGGPVTGAGAGTGVADRPFDRDPGGGEPGVRAGQERGGGFLALVGQDLGVGQPGVVVQGGVQAAVADGRVAALA